MGGGLHLGPRLQQHLWPPSSSCRPPESPPRRPMCQTGRPGSWSLGVHSTHPAPPAHALSRQDLQPIAPPDPLCVAEVSLSGVSLTSFQLKTLRVPTTNHGWHLPGAASWRGGVEREWGDRTELHRGQGRSMARAADTQRSPGEARPRPHSVAGEAQPWPAGRRQAARFLPRDADTSRRKPRAGKRLYPADKPASWTRCFSRAGRPSSDLSGLRAAPLRRAPALLSEDTQLYTTKREKLELRSVLGQ